MGTLEIDYQNMYESEQILILIILKWMLETQTEISIKFNLGMSKYCSKVVLFW